MKINKVLIGNAQDAFIEENFSENINIISSDDNNKGKTIVIQSIMYALGNDPIFPSSFKFKNYYHIVEIEMANLDIVSICRKEDSFIILLKGNIYVFDNLSEFKYYINRTLYKLPFIIKDGIKKLVDPMLFYQIFFVGQDNKNTSNIFLSGYYKKEDFINMLYSYYGIDVINDGKINQDKIKNNIKSLKAEKKELQRQNKILKSAFSAVKIVSMTNDRMKFEEKLNKINSSKNQIIKLNSKRNNAVSRKIKNEITLKELRSLNQSLTAGKLHCLDCDSSNIGYSTSDKSYTFDITSIEIRKQILSSIEDKISAYQEEVEGITLEINKNQEELKSLLSEDEVSIESLLMYKPDLINASKADSELINIDNEIKKFKDMLDIEETTLEGVQEERNKLYNNIIDEMNYFYNNLNPHGNMIFKDLFSKKQSVYSGCEETEFYLSKLYALLSVYKHEFPIIMDCFRAGELSSVKEEMVLKLFSEFKNQVIFTVTLKEEEIGKYDHINSINHINYMSHIPCKLLSSKYVEQFLKFSRKFALTIV